MKTGTIMKSLVWIVLLACFFVAPLVLIWQLSQAEIAAYEPPVEMEILLGAYGEAKRPVRQDVQEYVTIGYSNGRTVCVTGAEEGKYYDSGYKAVLEGGS